MSTEKKTIRVDFTETEFNILQRILNDLRQCNNVSLLKDARNNAQNASRLISVMNTNKQNSEGVYTRNIREANEKLDLIVSAIENKKANKPEDMSPRNKVSYLVATLMDLGFTITFEELPIHENGVHAFETRITAFGKRLMGHADYIPFKRPVPNYRTSVDEQIAQIGKALQEPTLFEKAIEGFRKSCEGPMKEKIAQIQAQIERDLKNKEANLHNILKRADEIVNQRAEEKERQYGPFSKSMERTASLFNMIRARKGESKLTPQDAFWVVACMKLAREGLYHKEDNLLDLVAYFGGLNNYEEGIRDK